MYKNKNKSITEIDKNNVIPKDIKVDIMTMNMIHIITIVIMMIGGLERLLNKIENIIPVVKKIKSMNLEAQAKYIEMIEIAGSIIMIKNVINNITAMIKNLIIIMMIDNISVLKEEIITTIVKSKIQRVIMEMIKGTHHIAKNDITLVNIYFLKLNIKYIL